MSTTCTFWGLQTHLKKVPAGGPLWLCLYLPENHLSLIITYIFDLDGSIILPLGGEGQEIFHCQSKCESYLANVS